jgi:hypothetical protein
MTIQNIRWNRKTVYQKLTQKEKGFIAKMGKCGKREIPADK